MTYRTANLQIAFYIFIQQILVPNILNVVYTLRFFSLKCSLFHNSNLFGSCIIHILYTECAKIKKKFRRQKVNTARYPPPPSYIPGRITHTSNTIAIPIKNGILMTRSVHQHTVTQTVEHHLKAFLIDKTWWWPLPAETCSFIVNRI